MVDTGAMAGRRLRLARIIAALAIAGLIASACASTGYHYVKNSDDKTYFKVPNEWKLFDAEQVLERNAKGLSDRETDTLRELSWEVRFDAGPKPSLRNFKKADYAHPIGIAQVEELVQEASDAASISALRNLYFDIDAAAEAGQGLIVSYEPVTLDGGFHGVHIVAEIPDEDGNTIVFNQKAVLDQLTSKFYAVVVFCNARCYDDNTDDIERLVDSWTVEE